MVSASVAVTGGSACVKRVTGRAEVTLKARLRMLDEDLVGRFLTVQL